MTGDRTHSDSPLAYVRPTLEQILRDANSKPVEDIHDLAVEAFFESDEELEEFLLFYREQRQRSILPSSPCDDSD